MYIYIMYQRWALPNHIDHNDGDRFPKRRISKQM